ncbi:MAG: lipoyl synthase [Betaproteobacteria bacterium]|nr:lipoyl synthase [Rhodocyclaceae bacterium]
MTTDPSLKQKGAAKTARIPIKVEPAAPLRKPDWIRVRVAPADSRFHATQRTLRAHHLHTVCEEASCPNIGECFGKGTATFMILGDKCTRRCPFCDVGHGRPDAVDANEPEHLARTVAALGLRYVVITSVDRDDLRDGGAGHFAACIAALRRSSPITTIEILVPDFRGRMEAALDLLAATPPDVFNHNLESVPRLYRSVRPGADYAHSLTLLKAFKARVAHVPTKSGLMVGLGEDDDEIVEVMRALRAHDVDMLTIGQYLQPSRAHLPVRRYVSPSVFDSYTALARELGFVHAACGPLVRSSYHADQQAHAAGLVDADDDQAGAASSLSTSAPSA